MAAAQATYSDQDLALFLKYYRSKPVEFIKDILGANTWYKQDEIVESVFRYKTTAVKTCNAVGKSFIAARVVVTFLTLYPGSVVVTTAPTWRQVTDVLWREIATTVKLSKVKLTDKDVKQAGLDYDKDWYAVGLSTKYPENFFGYHADHILVVVDEAGGVPEPIFRGVKAITPNANARILYIGNPTNPDGTFAEVFDIEKNLPVNRISISAFDSPNFTANGITDVDTLVRVFTPPPGISVIDHIERVNSTLKLPYPALISPAVVFERFHEWGVDSPAWQSLVMGEFPSQAEYALIPTHLVKQAMDNDGVDAATGKTFAELSGWNIPDGEPEYGLDMARFGADRTVLTPRRGGHVEKQVVWNKADLMESADRVVRIINPEKERAVIKIDDTGNGGGTTDRLVQIRNTRGGNVPYLYQVVPYNFGNAARNTDKFHDITSELYWNLRGWFMRHAISLPYDKELFYELAGRRWELTPRGLIKVESKDDYIKRTGGRSPDKSDSLALAFAPGSGNWYSGGDSDHNKRVSEWGEDDDNVYNQAGTITGGLLNKRY